VRLESWYEHCDVLHARQLNEILNGRRRGEAEQRVEDALHRHVAARILIQELSDRFPFYASHHFTSFGDLLVEKRLSKHLHA
jgi:hypothetical protein